MVGFLQNKKTKVIIVMASRLLIGTLFTIFGFLRAVNPIGGAYKVESYLNAAGLHFFLPASLILTILFAAWEFALGVCTLLGTNIRSTSLFMIVMMAFLLPFGIYNAYFVPVQNNDSFSDVMWINDTVMCWLYLIFLLISILIFTWKKHSYSPYTHRTEWTIALYSFFTSILLSIYCYVGLPILDFSPYHTGVDISKYEAKQPLIGIIDPNTNSNFTIHHQERIKLANGRTTAAIQFYSPEDGDVTHKILDHKGYTFLLIADDLNETKTGHRHEINDLYEYAQENGYPFYCVTSSPTNGQIAEEYIVESDGAEYPLINADQRVLRSIIRSNPGLILIKDGVIYRKWSNNELPTFTCKLDKDENATLRITSNGQKIAKFAISFCSILLAILILDWLIGLLRWTIIKVWHKLRKKIKRHKVMARQSVNNTETETVSEEDSEREKRRSEKIHNFFHYIFHYNSNKQR